MRHFLLVISTAVLMVGCSSAVKLDSVPVEDKVGTSVVQSGSEGQGSMVNKGGVTAVDIGGTGSQATLPSGSRVVYFDYDSVAIKPEFQSVIDAHARYMKADKSRKVMVEGHTDERGGREYNLALGQKRAEAVRSALGLLGVVDGQIEAVSFGKEKPAVQGSDEVVMAKNRRAEISYR